MREYKFYLSDDEFRWLSNMLYSGMVKMDEGIKDESVRKEFYDAMDVIRAQIDANISAAQRDKQRLELD